MSLLSAEINPLPWERNGVQSQYSYPDLCAPCLPTPMQCLADRIGVSCSLVRGEYNRAWNEVLLPRRTASVAGFLPQPRAYIVDLMHQPGSLLKANSPAAVQYQTI